MAEISEQQGAPAVADRPSLAYAHYVLVLMTLVYAANWMARQILGIAIPQIKLEFQVQDWEIGALTGPAFAIVYAVTGIPISVFSDRFNRRNVIVGSIALFGGMTLLSGYCVQFWQLFFLRAFTGIGEAGTSPAITSMLCDLYPKEWRGSVMAFYAGGASLGILLAFFGGGWIAQRYGWRDAFIAAGIFSLALAVLIVLTVDEPSRGRSESLAPSGEAGKFRETVRFLWRQRTFGWVALGAAFSCFGSYAFTAFVPLFLKTSHAMSLTQIGVALALLMGVGGALGSVITGRLCDYFGRHDLRGYLWVLIGSVIFTLPLVPVYFLAASTFTALLAAIIPSAAQIAYTGPIFAIAQMVVPLRMRAQAIACQLFIANMLGLGTGPFVVGLLSDVLRPAYGADSLRLALLSTMVTMVLSAVCYGLAARSIREDVARVARMA